MATLYRGPQWAAARAVVEAAGPNARGYVVSAGLGLRPLDWLAPAYEATFSSGPNSPLAVARKRGWQTEDAASEWWHALIAGGGWRQLIDVALGAKPKDPAPQATDGPDNPRSQVLVVLSAPYWRAVGGSLALALQARPDVADRVWLLCAARVRLPEPAVDRLLPTQGVDWAGFFGCRQAEAGLRLAAWLLETPVGEWEWDEVAGRLDSVRTSFRPVSRPRANPLTDAQVGQFIASALKKEPDLSATKLLRRLRDSGRACEQRRFGALFQTVRGEMP